MKRVFIAGVILFFTGLSFTSCRDAEEKETVVKEVEVEREQPEEVEEERKGILERAGEKVDGKVNKEVDEEIDKIGDDN